MQIAPASSSRRKAQPQAPQVAFMSGTDRNGKAFVPRVSLSVVRLLPEPASPRKDLPRRAPSGAQGSGAAWVWDTRTGHTCYVGEVCQREVEGTLWPEPHGFGHRYQSVVKAGHDYTLTGMWDHGVLRPGKCLLQWGAASFEGNIDAQGRFKDVGVWRGVDGEEVIARWESGVLQQGGVVRYPDGRVASPANLAACLPVGLDFFA